MKARKLGGAIALVAGLGLSGTAQANNVTYWMEGQQDAGGLYNPQDVLGFAGGIKGAIGDGDNVDVFRFRWLYDGQMNVTYVGEVGSLTSLYVSLFDPEILNDPLVDPYPLQVNATANFGARPAGTYLFKVATDSRIDPPFSFTLTGPTTAQQGITIGPVPEPATLALIGVGLAGLGWSRRRTR